MIILIFHLNKIFLKIRKIRIKKKINSIIILQGGSDTHCFIPKILDALNSLDDKINLKIVIEHQEKDGDGHAECRVWVGRRYNLEKRNSCQQRYVRDQVNWNKVHKIHQEHPDQDGQG